MISTALLGRARSIAIEHTKLSDALAQDFDPTTARKIGELSAVASTLRKWEKASEVEMFQEP